MVDKTWAAKQIKAFEGMQILLDDAKRNLFEVFTEGQTNDGERKSRVLEFLGDVFSRITGVPSTTDHRMIIEKLKLLKLDNDGIQTMMAKTFMSIALHSPKSLMTFIPEK